MHLHQASDEVLCTRVLLVIDLVRVESWDSARFQYLAVDWISIDDEYMNVRTHYPHQVWLGWWWISDFPALTW